MAEQEKQIRKKTGAPPKGSALWRWLGPAVLWALSSVGAGEIFYGPRVGARYGESFLWAILIVILFAWLISREIGRYTIISGKTIMEGYQDVPGPRHWADWLFFLTHMADITLFTAGQAALAGSLMALLFPGGRTLWTAILITISVCLIVFGGYQWVNKASAWLAGLLLVGGIVSLMRVFPPWSQIVSGLIPTFPKNFDLYFLLPWIGFLLVHGAPWFSYWVDREGFGRGKDQAQGAQNNQNKPPAQDKPSKDPSGISPAFTVPNTPDKADQLRGWVGVMSLMDGAGTILAGIFAIIFYILGAQLLGGKNVASGIGIGTQMAQQLQNVWGPLGLWLFAITAGISFWTTVLAAQDGATRMVTDLTQILTQKGEYAQNKNEKHPEEIDPEAVAQLAQKPAFAAYAEQVEPGVIAQGLARQDQPSRAEPDVKEDNQEKGGFWQNFLSSTQKLRYTYVIFLGGIFPILLLLFYNHPLQILSISGIIGAAITPVFTFLTLWLNRQRLPKGLQPNWLSFWGTVVAGLFFTTASILFFLNLFGITLGFL